MAIPSDQLRFRLTFAQHTQTMPVSVFREAEWSEEEQHATTITENVDLAVLFQCDDPQARFYMSGLELLPADVVKVDEWGMAYLSPGLEPYELFKTTGEYYPLIPGFYPVIVVAYGVRYHSSIQVLPKQMTLEQWQIMRDELEQELRGLAQDTLRKKLGLDHFAKRNLPAHLMQRFLIIQKRFPGVMAALHDLLNKANFRIRKAYQMMPLERAKSIDEVTVRHRLSHPEHRQSLKVPTREVEYDLPENQWVRRILHVVSGYLDEIMETVEGQAGLTEVYEEARKMKHSLQLLRTTPWFEQVGLPRQTVVPPVLMYDPRYRTLYQLFREVQADQTEVTLDVSYVRQWKRTDLLYEMWGFLQLCKSLSNTLGYEAVSGWLFDLQAGDGALTVPTLPPETQVVFASGDVRLQLSYDATIPSRREEVSLPDTPLYTVDIHNRPDGRLDVYKADVYMGSMMIDFKYRPKYWIWDVSKRVTMRPASMGQLLSYGHSCMSPHLLMGHLPEGLRGRLQPVLEVWAMYPSDWGGDPVQYDDEYRVRLIRATPGEDNAHVAEELKMGIARMLEQV